jgi:hypothetical protein
VSTERRNGQAALAARDRGQRRLRAVTVAIGATSILAGGAVAYGLPGAAQAQSPVTSTGSSGTGGQGSSSGAAGSGSAQSGSSTGTSGSSGLKSTPAPSSGSGTGQVTSGGS